MPAVNSSHRERWERLSSVARACLGGTSIIHQPTKSVSEAAIEVLNEMITGSNDLPYIYEALGNSNKYVRINAILLIGKLGKQAIDAIDILEDIAESDEEPEVIYAALKAMKNIYASSKEEEGHLQ